MMKDGSNPHTPIPEYEPEFDQEQLTEIARKHGKEFDKPKQKTPSPPKPKVDKREIRIGAPHHK
jgi:hypothetical protein